MSKHLKILLGGSPCTHWSIAQKNNRETEPSGRGIYESTGNRSAKVEGDNIIQVYEDREEGNK